MSAASQLRPLVNSPVLESGDTGYDRARSVWNADIDRRPAAIVQCLTPEDVSSTLRWAVPRGYEITVRGGGHNLAGTAVLDEAIMIDLSLISGATIDRANQTITVGGGAALGQLDRAAAAEGVTVPAGTVSHTGVGGLTLGGGNGYLSRLHGLTTDHLVSADVVLADGRIVKASEDENADLFWALRGAGHNFGVVTHFTYRYLPRLYTANVRQALYAADSRADVLQFFRDWSYDGAPDDVTTYARLVEAPEYWTALPIENRGRPILSVATIHWGAAEDEERVTAPMFAQASSIWDTTYRVPHLELQHACDDDFRHGLKHYWRAGNLVRFPDEAIETTIRYSDMYPGRALQASSTIAPHFTCPFQLFPLGGQFARADASATSVGDRTDSRWVSTLGGEWEFDDEREPIVEWTREFDDQMAPYKQGAYVNFSSLTGGGLTARWFYGDKYDRLVSVKREVDPTNVFHHGVVDLLDETETAPAYALSPSDEPLSWSGDASPAR